MKWGDIVRVFIVDTIGGTVWYRVRWILRKRRGMLRVVREVVAFTGYREPS